MERAVPAYVKAAKLLEVIALSVRAECLQVPKSSFSNLLPQGLVPDQKVGEHWRFHKVAVDEWLRCGGATR